MKTEVQGILHPLSDPLLVFTILLAILLVAPTLFKRFRIPGIIGLIAAGMLVGPNGLNLVDMGESIRLLSTAGLLYLMFLAGLELNIAGFKKSKNKSLAFGALTFFIPLILGFAASYWLLGYGSLPSLLMASMFSTHTLISYPIASRLGITRSEAVTISIGGTIITDTAVLLLLVIISALSKGSMDAMLWIRLTAVLAFILMFNLWLIPALSRWFFMKLEGDSATQFIYVLSVFFFSGMVAKLGGIEPIIGAFIAGLGLSSTIPRTSALMNRVIFVGNSIFIPIFLVSVGMLVDFRVFGSGYGAISFSALLIIVAIFSKYAAAWLTQQIFKFSSVERNAIFGLSVSHAAAIIAVALVGYELKLIDTNVLNGAILIILFSCLISSFVTEAAGRKLAIMEAGKTPDTDSRRERILVPVANPATIEGLVDFAILIKDNGSPDPVYMLTVVPDDEKTSEQILKNNKAFESVISHAAAADSHVTLVSRVDLNVVTGISRAMQELIVNKVVIGWNGKVTTTDFIFGSLLDNLVSHTEQMIMVTKLSSPLSSFKRIVVFVPEHGESEKGCQSWVQMLLRIATRLNSGVKVCGTAQTIDALTARINRNNPELTVHPGVMRWFDKVASGSEEVTADDLVVFISARRRTMSYHHNLDLHHLPRELARHYEKNSFVILYPEQRMLDDENISLNLDGMDTSPISENIDRLNNLSVRMRKLIRRRRSK